MRTTYLSDKLLNHTYRNVAFTSPTTVYVGLLSAVTDAEAGTVTELAYSGYARVALTAGAPAAAGGGRRIQNSGLITFPAKGDVGIATAIAFGIFDALTVGNLLDVVFLDGADPIAFIGDDTGAELLSSPAHGLVTDQRVRLETFPGGQTLPAGLSENTTYWVIATGLTADQFKLSTTQGGAAVDITAFGRGILMRLTPKDISPNDIPQFSANLLSLYDD